MSIALAAFAVGSSIQAYSAYQQAIAQNRQLQYQKGVALYNAETALYEGDFAYKTALKAEKTHRDTIDQLIGSQRARMGASGFSIESGSYQDIIDTTAVLGELDALAIRYEGELQRWKKQEEAAALRDRAKMLEAGKVDPLMAFGTSLLTSGVSGARFF